MTTHTPSSTATDDLPRVDPPAGVSLTVRAFAAFLATGLGRWIAKNIAPKVDPWLLRATGGRLSMGLMLPRRCSRPPGPKPVNRARTRSFTFTTGPTSS